MFSRETSAIYGTEDGVPPGQTCARLISRVLVYFETRGRKGGSVHRQATADLHFAVEQRAVESFDKVHQLFWVLFSAGCFGKCTPIFEFGLHVFLRKHVVRSRCMPFAKFARCLVFIGLDRHDVETTTFLSGKKFPRGWRLSCSAEAVALSPERLYSAGAEALSETRPTLTITMERLPILRHDH